MANSNINILQEMREELNNGERKCVIKMETRGSDAFTLDVTVREIECVNDTVVIYTEPGEFLFDTRTTAWEIIDDDEWKTYKINEEDGNFYCFCFV